MSQTDSTDTDPFTDTLTSTPLPLQNDPEPSLDAPADLQCSQAPLQEPLVSEPSEAPGSTTQQAVEEGANGAHSPPDQPEHDDDSSLIECNQTVSLEPETVTTEDVESSQVKGWGGWSSWGKSLLSTASSSVGQSLSSVKEKAGEALRLHRASVGEEAHEEMEGEDGGSKAGERGEAGLSDPTQLSSSPSGRGVFSTITHAVQNTGKSVISGGLDALEYIGKKTMTVLAESDPGFKKTKTLMEKTASLSQMLKEAKEKERARLSNQPINQPTAHYGILFDDYQGLSHLEALEILSNESEAKVQAFLSSLEEEGHEEVKNELSAIKEIFISRREEAEEEEEKEEEEKQDNADGEEFVSVLTELLFELHVAATPDKLNKARMKAHDWVREVEQSGEEDTPGETKDKREKDPTPEIKEETTEEEAVPGEKEVEEKKEGGLEVEEGVERAEPRQQDEDGKDSNTNPRSVEAVYLSSVGSLAEVTARSIEQLHKVAELILHGQEVEKPARDQAHILSRLTCAMCKEVDCLAKKFSDTLLAVGAQRKAEELMPFVDSVLLEGSNSTTYVQNGFQLLLPVLQISHLQNQHNTSTLEPPPAHTQH